MIEKQDRYTADNVCVVCLSCEKFYTKCGGKNLVIYANSANDCPHFVERNFVNGI
ncbi:MAG: hypothetical protein FWF51_06490 [Chitinivibrionia bacterium]|nr:hypothetical protein [Chitinivibrionia bacterium]